MSLGEIKLLCKQEWKCCGDQEQVLRRGLLYHGSIEQHKEVLFGV